MSETIILNEQRNQVCSKGTFAITVKFMQNSTWQGHIHWMEEDKKQHFRSVLEMLKLMDEALAETAQDTRQVSWDEEKPTKVS